MNRSWGLALALCGSAIACTLGCALVKTQEAQLFAGPSRYESASITYRIAPSTRAASAVQQASFKEEADAKNNEPQRKMTLAIRYPHPAGRAGYARVEYVVESAGAAATKKWLPRWLDQARRMANDSLPGLSMADGVEEAMGLDLPMTELDKLVERLQQPLEPAAATTPVPGVVVVAKINGVALVPRHARMTELDAVIGRVRQEGRLIAYKAVVVDAELEALANASPARAASHVVPASYTAPVGQSASGITRLPPVASPAP